MIAGTAVTRWVEAASATLLVLLALDRPLASSALDAGPAKASPARMEVVFVVDTTGSMGGLLEAAKEQIWAIVTQLACAQPTPELRLGIVAYRDRGDAYVTRRFDLTTDMDALYAELVALQPAGGGDTPESVNQALHEAVTAIGWSADPGTYRAIFLVGDAPPQMYANDVAYPQSCQLARERGITISAIQCGEIAGTTPVWTQIAELGNGAFVRLTRNGEAPVIATPYDKPLAAMARQLDGTRFAYGTDDERAAFAERQARAEHIHDHSSLGVQASRSGFNATVSGRKNLYGRKDLLADLRGGLVKLDDLDAAQLPESLRAMTADERRAFLDQQARLREDLEWTIHSVAAERQTYLVKEQDKRGGGAESLTARLSTAIQPQAARHGFTLGPCAPAPPPR
jgi:hypothetical protein